MSGAYSITIVSRYAARFTTAVGTSERFGTPVERAGDRPSTLSETEKRIGDWYSEPKGISTAEALDSQPVDNAPADEPSNESNTNSSGSNNKLSKEDENIIAGEQVTKEVVELTESSNSAIWFIILIGIAVGPVTLVIRRLRNPKPSKALSHRRWGKACLSCSYQHLKLVKALRQQLLLPYWVS